MGQQAGRARIQGRSLSVLAPNDAQESVSAEEFERIALSDRDHKWELFDGVLREKPRMSVEHNEVELYLATSLVNQLDRRQFRVRSDSARVRRTSRHYYIPDVLVIPADSVRSRLGRPDRLEVLDEPLPLVIEVWSRSTGKYDINTKIPEYKVRGDLEIWRLHPYERTLTVWRRQTDGTYGESHYQGGKIKPDFLPNVTIDLDALVDLD